MDSNFPFVTKQILRSNLDVTFDHIVVLLQFTESAHFTVSAKSAFRKTIIIHTASIVEALLFHVLDISFSEQAIAEYYGTWKLQNKKQVYEFNDKSSIVAGEYNFVPGDGRKEKLNLGQITTFLKDKEVLSRTLVTKIESLRDLRNEQHIGTHANVKSYSKKDLEKAFGVAREVKAFARDWVKRHDADLDL